MIDNSDEGILINNSYMAYYFWHVCVCMFVELATSSGIEGFLLALCSVLSLDRSQCIRYPRVAQRPLACSTHAQQAQLGTSVVPIHYLLRDNFKSTYHEKSSL